MSFKSAILVRCSELTVMILEGAFGIRDKRVGFGGLERVTQQHSAPSGVQSARVDDNSCTTRRIVSV